MECALKYILLTYGRKADGEKYTLTEIKKVAHNTVKLNTYLDDWISVTDGIEARFRFNSRIICPHIFTGEGGYPKYRYGEHPQWELQSFSLNYIRDNVVIGGH